MKLRNLKKVVSVVLLGAVLLSCHAEAVNVQWNGGTKEDIDLTITAGSGSCGDNMTWELDESGTLTISGTGKMYNYADYDKGIISFPWLEKNNEAAITSVNIENGVESISACALFGTSVKKVTIPDSVKEIGNDAISNCKNLKEIILPDNIETLSEGVFNYDTSLPRIKLPRGLKEIPMYAFLGCSSLNDIVLPENVTEIGERAFANCTSLETIVIPPSVTSITTTSFQNAAGLKKVLFPPGIKVIEAAAFLGCANIEEIILPDGLEKIEHNAFAYSDTPRASESRQKVYIPASVTQIDNKSPFSKNVIIYGFKNSTAETYAKEKGMEFVEISESMYDADSYKEAYYSQFQSKFENLLVGNGGKLSISPDNTESKYSDYTIEAQAFYADSFGLMSGYEDGTFRPDNPITRAEFTSSLMRAAVIAYPDAQAAEINFSDTDASYWAYDDIAKAVSIGFISGYEDGTFRPNDNITYEQAVTMIFNLLGYKPVAEIYGGFPNAYMSLGYYNRFFKTSVENRGGIIEMNADKQKNNVTRRDALNMLSAMLTTPICVVTNYKTAFDGSKEPVYSIGGDGIVTQTLFSMKNVTLITD